MPRQRAAPGAAIRFAVGPCTLGSVLVAASDNGVCAILLGDDPDRLTRDLQDRFPHATLTPGGPDFGGHVAAAIGLVEHPAAGLCLPLDVRGTPFQLRVWQALRDIPPGTTVTYTDLATQIGRPTAARAVATACAANRLAVAIPCHRVVRTDETLSGYRWGVERKAELLRRERACDFSRVSGRPHPPGGTVLERRPAEGLGDPTGHSVIPRRPVRV